MLLGLLLGLLVDLFLDLLNRPRLSQVQCHRGPHFHSNDLQQVLAGQQPRFPSSRLQDLLLLLLDLLPDLALDVFLDLLNRNRRSQVYCHRWSRLHLHRVQKILQGHRTWLG